MQKEGFVVEATNMAPGELSQFKTRHGISPDLASCHTARVAGYTIEGHVPAREINRLRDQDLAQGKSRASHRNQFAVRRHRPQPDQAADQ